jgi:hypothetical protein
MAYPDPIYGANPIDPEQRWWDTIRPPLANDPEIQVWQTVVSEIVNDLLESAWLVRWRCAGVLTAEGIHLDTFGRDLGFLRPDGWSDERYSAVLSPIEGVAFGIRVVPTTQQLAEGLVQVDQEWTIQDADPATYIITFLGVTADEALTYFSVLNLGRPKGVRMVMVHSPDPDAVFILGSSLLGGPDVLAGAMFSEDY